MTSNHKTNSRRKFLYDLGLTTLSIPMLSSFSHCTGGNSRPEENNNEKESEESGKSSKLGIALVGLGSYAEGQLAPALLETEHCFLAGAVTGSPEKIQDWKNEYRLKDQNIYSYDTFDSIKDNKDIDIVYIVLPNSLHEEYVVRAAKAGKHVICEKPMAITTEACDRMITACNDAGVKLSIGYRLHFEPYNLEMVRLAKEKVFGKLKSVSSGFGFRATAGQWRLNKELAGGGPLMDVGIYCIQAACYVTGSEPISVTAKEGPKTDLERFKTVEQSISWQFEMPDNVLATGECSYESGMNYLKAEAQNGSFELSPAFSYRGLKGKSSDGLMDFDEVNQQARQMDDFALAITNNSPTPVPGEMGKRDVKLINAIYEAARSGKKITL
jgi:predicted dehydrogenase